MTIAHNLSTGETQDFTCSPKQAVVAAYAQERKDWNTWDYEKRYNHLVEYNNYFVTCGDWTAKQED